MTTPNAIDGPPAQPPGYSLLIAADTTADDAPRTWQQGVKWSPEQIGGGGVSAISCGSSTMSNVAAPNQMSAQPVAVWAEDTCSTTGHIARDYEGRARRQLEATQSFHIAREFQLGTIRDAQSLPNVALKDATALHPGYVDPIRGLGELEAALGETFGGRRGMLHVPPQLFTSLANVYFVKQGQRWVTPLGNVVATDAGYDTESDGVLYMYATGPVSVKLGKAFLNPGSFEEAMANGMIDTSINKVRVYAERLALVEVDGVIAATPGTGTADAMFKIQTNVAPWALHS